MVLHWKSCGAAAIVAVVAIASEVFKVAADGFNPYSYDRNASLSSNLDLFWTIDSDLATIRVAVHAKAASGWAGLGMSEMGGMEGADIVYYEAKTGKITDAYAINAGMPITDECTQDWTFVSAEVGADGLIFEAERALDTGDSQDRAFVDDSLKGALPTTIFAAWGDSESVVYHGTNFIQGQVIMFGGDENSNVDPLIGITSSPSVSFFDVTTFVKDSTEQRANRPEMLFSRHDATLHVTQKNFNIPTSRTWYEETCITAAELPDLDEYHAIGFEAIVQSSTSEYVHHLNLYAYKGSDDCGHSCLEYYNNRSQSTGSSKVKDDASEIPSYCVFDLDYIHLWAPGMADEQLPDNVGFRFGSAHGGYTSMKLQTHYNNVNGDGGMVDSSGMRIYYTEEMRPMDMGVLALGDPGVALRGTSIFEGKSSIAFECPGSCTEDNFEVEAVTVSSHLLHMHENGQRMVTRQYRKDGSGNEVLVHTADVEYYSFSQAGGYVINTNDSPTIQVLPFSGSCGYQYCNGSMTGYSALDADSHFNRTFGEPTSCKEEGGGQTHALQGRNGSLECMGFTFGFFGLYWYTTCALDFMNAFSGLAFEEGPCTVRQLSEISFGNLDESMKSSVNYYRSLWLPLKNSRYSRSSLGYPCCALATTVSIAEETMESPQTVFDCLLSSRYSR